MKKLVLILCTAFMFCLVSCGTTVKLYNWGNYEKTSYEYLKAPNEETLADLIKSYEYIMSHQDNVLRQTVPPGICADYGYFLIRSGKTKEGMDLLEKEIELYPESKTFITSVKEMINGKK